MYIYQVEENRFIQTGTEDSPKLVKKKIVQPFKRSATGSGTTTPVIARCTTSARNLQNTTSSLLLAFKNACKRNMSFSKLKGLKK